MKNEEELHHNIVHNIFGKEQQKQYGIEANAGKLYTGDLKSEPTIGEDVKANFIQVPEVSSVPAVRLILFFSILWTIFYAFSLQMKIVL